MSTKDKRRTAALKGWATRRRKVTEEARKVYNMLVDAGLPFPDDMRP